MEKFENAIINTQNLYYMYKFLEECKCINNGKLISAIANIEINGETNVINTNLESLNESLKEQKGKTKMKKIGNDN